MGISKPFRRSVSGLISLFVLALTLPNLPLGRTEGAVPSWDARSYAVVAFMIAPLICIWCAVGRSRAAEGAGWILLLVLIVGLFSH